MQIFNLNSKSMYVSQSKHQDVMFVKPLFSPPTEGSAMQVLVERSHRKRSLSKNKITFKRVHGKKSCKAANGNNKANSLCFIQMAETWQGAEQNH